MITTELLDLSVTQVRKNLIYVREHLLGVFGRDVRENDALVTNLPVGGRSDLVSVCHTDRVDKTNNLSEVTTSRSRVCDRCSHLVVLVDDKDGASSERHALVITVVRIDHTQQAGNLIVLVVDNGEIHDALVDLLDLLDPGLVVDVGIDGQPKHRDGALRPLIAKESHFAKLSSAYWGMSLKVREEQWRVSSMRRCCCIVLI